MAVLHVRNIPESLYKRMQRLAEARGRTLSALVIDLLEEADHKEAARKRFDAAMAVLRQRPYMPPATSTPGAADLIRTERDEREGVHLSSGALSKRNIRHTQSAPDDFPLLKMHPRAADLV